MARARKPTAKMPPYISTDPATPVSSLRIRTPREVSYDSDTEETNVQERLALKKNKTFYSVMAVTSFATLVLITRTCKGGGIALADMTAQCKLAMPVSTIWLFASVCMYCISCEAGDIAGERYWRPRSRSEKLEKMEEGFAVADSEDVIENTL